jgi:hypothetical protein
MNQILEILERELAFNPNDALEHEWESLVEEDARDNVPGALRDYWIEEGGWVPGGDWVH